MGTDCCGTPESEQNGTPHNMQNGTNLITKETPAPAKGKHAPAARPHKEYVKAREPYYKKRVDLFQQYHQREVDRIAAAKEANKSISITLPDGNVQTAVAGVTTPMDIAKTLSKSVSKKAVVAKVKSGETAEAITWDLLRPLEADSTLELFSFEDKIGKDVSTSHICLEPWFALVVYTSCCLFRCVEQPAACLNQELSIKLLTCTSHMHKHAMLYVCTRHNANKC